MEARCADHATLFYSQNLAVTSLTSGGRSVGIAHLRTKSHRVCVFLCDDDPQTRACGLCLLQIVWMVFQNVNFVRFKGNYYAHCYV
jgi:hypothetical protein